MALTKLDVKGIKDGTDGQLITWDPNTIADTVATGTTTQVLLHLILIQPCHNNCHKNTR